MKVADVMQRHIDVVNASTPIKEVARFIFGHGINGLPVCEIKKVIGFITERDILNKFYPSIHEYLQDSEHIGDFEAMENKANDVFALTAADVMSKQPITVLPDTPILHALSLMFVHKIGRLPVVDKQGNLVGLISKRNIFRAVVNKKIAFEEEEKFFDWLARYYDNAFDWNRRLSLEIPDLVSLFNKQQVHTILDVASSTGEHAVALAKEGFQVIGVEISTFMYDLSIEKRSLLPSEVQERLTFEKGLYAESLKKVQPPVDAALFMGSALPYVMYTDRDILEQVSTLLRPKKATLILQTVNFDKLLRREGFRDFNLAYNTEQETNPFVMMIAFYTRQNDELLNHTRAVFNYIGNRWEFRGIHSTPVVYLNSGLLLPRLKALGFSTKLHGGLFYSPLFGFGFRQHTSDWLTVVATR